MLVIPDAGTAPRVAIRGAACAAAWVKGCWASIPSDIERVQNPILGPNQFKLRLEAGIDFILPAAAKWRGLADEGDKLGRRSKTVKPVDGAA